MVIKANKLVTFLDTKWQVTISDGFSGFATDVDICIQSQRGGLK